MGKRYFLSLSLVVLAFVLITPKIIAYSVAKDGTNALEPYINFYDANNHLMDAYTQNQIEELVVETDIYKPSKDSESGEFYVNFYDENGLLINPDANTKKEMTELSEGNKHKLFVFRNSSFLNNIAIGQNRTFYRPESIIVEPASTFESVTINLFDSVGQKVGKIEMGNILGGINIPLANYVQDDAYSIQFVNEKQGEKINILGGIVIYN